MGFEECRGSCHLYHVSRNRLHAEDADVHANLLPERVAEAAEAVTRGDPGGGEGAARTAVLARGAAARL